MKTLHSHLNDGVRIIVAYQFSEAENGNMLVRAHQFTCAGTAGSLRDRQGNLSKTFSRKNCSILHEGSNFN